VSPASKQPQPKPRMHRWAEREFVYAGYTFVGGLSRRQRNLARTLEQVRSDYYASIKEPIPQQTLYDWIRHCKEIVYDKADGKPVFHLIAMTYNVGRGEMEIGELLQRVVSADSVEEVNQEIRVILAFAALSEVPVFPNTPELVPELAQHHRDLLVHGFRTPDGTGKIRRLSLTRFHGASIEKLEILRQLPLTEPLHPAELILLRNAVERELERLSAAESVLGALALAVESLDDHLSAKRRNEAALQRCLTANPVLFGLDYRRVLPKHRLGAEYEMDYALERVSGLVDLVEIEASTHRLFNSLGDPTKDLVHAEQQVLNWLDWLERQHAYARETLPGLVRPRGYVVIGRRSSLSPADQRRLDRRNALFGESLQVLTYEDVLSRARNMIDVLGVSLK
jgi:hypothetical protein